MVYQGVLKKMMTENAEEIQYYLDMKSDFLNMNQLINKEVAISFVKRKSTDRDSANLVFLIFHKQQIGS